MILNGSQRGGARKCSLHLLKTTENEHVEVHEVRGFMADDLMGALMEAEAISKGTKCKQFMFTVSLNPPENEDVRIEVFESALAAIEERTGLTGQPRVVVFHEKNGRRHAHAVWSRIDANTMTAINMDFFKNRLREVSRELYLEHGWQMPRGLMDSKERDLRNFTLDQWQEAMRSGCHAAGHKNAILECWAVSDNRQSFIKALEERGLFLARGERDNHVAVSFDGQVFAIPRVTGRKTKEVADKLGSPAQNHTVERVKKDIGSTVAPRLKSYLAEARGQVTKELAPLEQKRQYMKAKHQSERLVFDAKQKARQDQEMKVRAERVRKGFSGLWDKLTGAYSKVRRQNELESMWARQRDREQRHGLIQAQLGERQHLQTEIRQTRARHAERLRGLHTDAANYMLMQRGEAPIPSQAFDRTGGPKTGDMQVSQELEARIARLKENKKAKGPKRDLDR